MPGGAESLQLPSTGGRRQRNHVNASVSSSRGGGSQMQLRHPQQRRQLAIKTPPNINKFLSWRRLGLRRCTKEASHLLGRRVSPKPRVHVSADVITGREKQAGSNRTEDGRKKKKKTLLQSHSIHLSHSAAPKGLCSIPNIYT